MLCMYVYQGNQLNNILTTIFSFTFVHCLVYWYLGIYSSLF